LFDAFIDGEGGVAALVLGVFDIAYHVRKANDGT
jgi:hypothetical protein